MKKILASTLMLSSAFLLLSCGNAKDDNIDHEVTKEEFVNFNDLLNEDNFTLNVKDTIFDDEEDIINSYKIEKDGLNIRESYIDQNCDLEVNVYYVIKEYILNTHSIYKYEKPYGYDSYYSQVLSDEMFYKEYDIAYFKPGIDDIELDTLFDKLTFDSKKSAYIANDIPYAEIFDLSNEPDDYVTYWSSYKFNFKFIFDDKKIKEYTFTRYIDKIKDEEYKCTYAYGKASVKLPDKIKDLIK